MLSTIPLFEVEILRIVTIIQLKSLKDTSRGLCRLTGGIATVPGRVADAIYTSWQN